MSISRELALASEMNSVALPQVVRELRERLRQAESSRDDAQRTTRWAVGGLAVVILATMSGIGITLNRFPLEKYLWTDNAKQYCEAQVQDDPLVTTNTVLDFAKECVLDMDTFAHDSWRKDIDRMSSRCLTPEFRKTLLQAEWYSDRVSTVRSGLLRVSSETTGPGVVIDSRPTAQGFLWRVQIPVKRNFKQGDSPKGSQERVYEVEVYRVVKNAYNPVGLGINGIYERSGNLR